MKEKNVFQNPLVMTLLALLCCALWGSATPFIKIGYELVLPERDVASTILFAGIRFFLAGVFTVIIFSIARRRFIYPKKENLGRVGIISIFQTIIQYIFFYLGLANTSGVKGTVISGGSVFFAILISSLIFRQEKLTVRKIVACIVGFAGIIVINFAGLEPTVNIGDVFVLLSTISLAISSVLIKRFSAHEDPVTISAYQFIVGGALMSIGALIAGGRVSLGDIRGILVLLYLALLSAVAYSVWGILLKFNPVSRVTVFTFMTPVFGVLLSLLLLTSEDSQVGPINLIITLVLVSLGIFILNYQKTKKEPEDGGEQVLVATEQQENKVLEAASADTEE